MFELNDIVRLKGYWPRTIFYKVIEPDTGVGLIHVKELNEPDSDIETYLTKYQIVKVTLSELLNYCKETNKRLHLSWIYSDTRKKLEKIIKSLEKDCEDFNYLQDHHLDYIFYFGNLTGKEYNELSTIDVFELDIDIDNTYANILREEEKNKIKTKDKRIKEKIEQLKIDVKLGDYIKYKDKMYYIVMIKDDFLYLIEQVFTTDPSVTLLTITFKDLAEYQDSLELHSEEIKMDTTTARIVDIKLDDNSLKNIGPTEVDLDTYCINDKCSTCKNEEYITRDEAKEMIEEMFNKINNKENKEMNEIKSMNTFDDIVDMVLEDLEKRDQNPEKEETKAKPVDELFKNEDTVEAIYINADKKVIVLKWNDGETTKAVCDPQDKFDIEAGVFLALAKRSYFYEEIAARCNWEGITPEMEKGIFFNLAADAYSINEIKRYVNWAKKVYAKQTKKEVKPKTSKKVK